MKKAFASLTVVLLLTAFGCSNWQKYTPKAMDDSAISAEIRKNLTAHGYTGMKVDVDHGNVYLEGDVKSAADRQAVIDEAKKVNGVQSVRDNISIKP